MDIVRSPHCHQLVGGKAIDELGGILMHCLYVGMVGTSGLVASLAAMRQDRLPGHAVNTFVPVYYEGGVTSRISTALQHLGVLAGAVCSAL